MKQERIRVRIKEDGTVSMEVEGIKGESCLAATADLEEALGVVTKRDKTKEYHERPARVTTKNVSSIHRK